MGLRLAGQCCVAQVEVGLHDVFGSSGRGAAETDTVDGEVECWLRSEKGRNLDRLFWKDCGQEGVCKI